VKLYVGEVVVAMDFIERLFSVSPDNGSGATEAFYLLIALVFLVVVGFRSRIQKLFRERLPRARS